jgi:cysteinyl-tRNA synthetase
MNRLFGFGQKPQKPTTPTPTTPTYDGLTESDINSFRDEIDSIENKFNTLQSQIVIAHPEDYELFGRYKYTEQGLNLIKQYRNDLKYNNLNIIAKLINNINEFYNLTGLNKVSEEVDTTSQSATITVDEKQVKAKALTIKYKNKLSIAEKTEEDAKKLEESATDARSRATQARADAEKIKKELAELGIEYSDIKGGNRKSNKRRKSNRRRKSNKRRKSNRRR